MDLSWLTILATAVAGFIVFYTFIFKNRFQKYGVPTPSSLKYYINQILIFMRKLTMVDNIQYLYDINKDAKYIGFYDANWPVIMIRDLELIKTVCVKNFDYFVDHRTFIDPELEPLFGNNLFSLKGDKWREVRNLLSPAFTSSKMKAMFKLMSQCADTFAQHLVDQSSKQPIDVNSKDIFTRYTNDTIATCAFGVAVDSMSNPNNEFYVLGRRATKFEGSTLMKMMFARMFPKVAALLRLKIISTDIEKFFCELVRDTIATRDEKGIVRPDMLQLMMETRNQKSGSKTPVLSIESMTSQAFIFFFGGFDSTSTLMCFAVHEIAANADVQQKLQEEMDQVFEKYGEFPYEVVNNMEYLDAVVNEALRLYPIGIMVDRMCTQTLELPPAVPGAQPFVVKPNDNIWIPIWSIHRNPEYYPEPDKFLPERFLGDAKENINSATYLPFGIGPRMCIGNRFALLETKVLILHLFHKCNATISKKMIMPMKFDPGSFNLLAKGGFWLEITPRKV